MIDKIKSKIVKMFKSGFCIRRVRRCIFRFKMCIAEILDNDDTCWAELVMWVYHRKFKEIFHFGDYKIQVCRKSNDGTPYAYCGKCDKTGKYFA